MKRHSRGATLGLMALCMIPAACLGPTKPPEPRPGPEALPEGKLPRGIRPTRYALNLRVVPDEPSFSGSVTIDLELDEPSTTIWMHGQDLKVRSIHALHGATRIEGSWNPQTRDGVVRVELPEALPAGRSALQIEYTAGFDTPLRGLYRVETAGRAYAFTQFESISARLAFPCFDEPRFKTPFDVTLTIPADQVAASNTPIDRATELPGGLRRIHFMPTPPLPTYLLAWAVGPLDQVEGRPVPATDGRPVPIPLRGISAAGQGKHLGFALERAGAYVSALEDYFGIPYPYRKLDLVAVPDFAAGAMENAGLITFREWLLLIDPKRATEDQYRAFAYVLAHELAHQWFGNLVTMPWWNDIWLNEGFATWMGNRVVQTLRPEYRSDLGALSSAHRAMRLDSLVSARSIRQPIESNHDIKNAFDAITYEKGGAVLTMFERWMGAEVFRRGIRLYLQRHQNGTATSGDLLAALDQVSGLDVTGPFLSYLTQPGVPLLSGVSDPICKDGARVVRLSQERYFPLGSDGDPHRRWQIPFCVRHEGGTTCGCLTEARDAIELPGCPGWWMPNEDGEGYLRFAMSTSDWTNLRTRGFAKISDRGRLAVADSVEAEFDRGVLDAQGLLAWFPQFAASPLRQLAVVPMRPLRFMIEHAAPARIQPEVRAYAARLYREPYQKLGWHMRGGDSSDTKLLREAIIRFMVMDVRDRTARSHAARLGKAYARNVSQSTASRVDPQLAKLALATAVQEGGEELFDHLLDVFESSDDSGTRGRILAALGHAEDPSLSARALDLALDPRLRVNEISRVLGAQFSNPKTRTRAWKWLTTHFDALGARFGASQVGGMPWYGASFCSEDAAAEVQEFFAPRVSELTGGPRNLAGAVEAIHLCAEKARVQGPSVTRTFASN